MNGSVTSAGAAPAGAGCPSPTYAETLVSDTYAARVTAERGSDLVRVWLGRPGAEPVRRDVSYVDARRLAAALLSAADVAEGSTPTHDEDDSCRECGAHISEPHAPGCANDPDPEDDGAEDFDLVDEQPERLTAEELADARHPDAPWYVTLHDVYADGVEPIVGRTAVAWTWEDEPQTGLVEADPTSPHSLLPILRLPDGSWIRLGRVVHLLPQARFLPAAG